MRPSLLVLLTGLLIGWLVPISVAQEEIDLGGTRIWGGEPTSIDQYPWQAALRLELESGATGMCGGSVIAHQWILTAAHCVSRRDLAKVEVKVGATDYSSEGSWQGVVRVIVHPNYDKKTNANDVALLEVEEGLDATIIPMAAASTELDAGEGLTVTGWGRTEDGKLSQVLRRVLVPYVEFDRCNSPEAYKGTLVNSMICAGELDRDSCGGDSGGPLVKGTSPATAILVGVVSFGPLRCGNEAKVGVYMKVGSFREWIKQQMSN